LRFLAEDSSGRSAMEKDIQAMGWNATEENVSVGGMV
jgi:hypothetical protein